MVEYEEVESNKQKSDYCAFCCLLLSYATLTVATFLSVICSWVYCDSDTADLEARAAAILILIALCGCPPLESVAFVLGEVKLRQD